MTQGSESSSIIHPTLHHFGVETRHLERMIEWYARVVGMVTIYQSSNALGSEDGVSMSAAFVSNDRANHRMAIFSTPELKADTDKHAHAKLQHVAFEYATIDDLLNTYTRLKGLLIEPVLTAIPTATALSCLSTTSVTGTSPESTRGPRRISTRTRWAPLSIPISWLRHVRPVCRSQSSTGVPMPVNFHPLAPWTLAF